MQVLHQVGLVTARVLTAMDLPEGTTQAISYTLDPDTYFGSAGPATGWPARLAAWQQELQWGVEAVSAGLRGFAEQFWQSWGAECVMLLLLAAALVGANAVSLLLLLLVVLGMSVAAAPTSSSSANSADERSRHGNSSTHWFSRGDSGAGSGVRHTRGVSWWWWHLVLGVLVLVLVSGLPGCSCFAAMLLCAEGIIRQPMLVES